MCACECSDYVRLCVLSATVYCSMCSAVPLEPVVSCVSVCATTLDSILELMSLYRKELGEVVEEQEARLGREGRKRELFAQPNSQCNRAEVGGED